MANGNFQDTHGRSTALKAIPRIDKRLPDRFLRKIRHSIEPAGLMDAPEAPLNKLEKQLPCGGFSRIKRDMIHRKK